MPEAAAAISTAPSRGHAAAAIAPKGWRNSWRRKAAHSVHKLMAAAALSFILTLLIAVPAQKQGQPRIDPFNLEARIHELINAEREKKKLRPLKFEERLAQIGRLHSRDMFDRKFFDHIDPNGKGPTARGRARGYTCRRFQGEYITEGLSENIFQNNLYNRVIFHGKEATYEWNTTEDIAQSTVKGWMNSFGHRHNILMPTFQREGIGVYIAPNDQVFITQMFC